jgi:hypothetical protein
MKTLPDGRIQIEAGDTLSGIYGSDWKALSGYTGDPTKLQIGTVLPAKPAGSLGGSLTGGTKEKTLPTPTIDRLSMFQDVLREITGRAGQEAKVSGAAALPEGMLKPEQVSGGTFADILNMVSQQKTRGISDIYSSTVELINNTRTAADRQLTMLINTGGIVDLDSAALKKLSDFTDYPLEYLQSMQAAVKKESTSASKLTDADRIGEINNFLKDKVGADGKIAASSYIEAYKKWIGLGGAVTDFKYAYPVEEWLGSWEYKNLPAGWQPKAQETVPDIKTLSADQQVFINQIQGRINDGTITYEEAIAKYPKVAVYLNPL